MIELLHAITLSFQIAVGLVAAMTFCGFVRRHRRRRLIATRQEAGMI